MFRGFFWKIWGLGILYSVFAICVALFGLANYHLRGEEKAILQRNNLLAQVVIHEVESGYLRGLWPYKTLKMVSDAEDVLFLWIAKPDGEIFWANEAEMMDKTIQDPFLGLEELKTRDSDFQGERVRLVAHPIRIELKEKPWTLFLGTSFSQLRKAQREIISLSLGFLALIVVFIGFVSFYLAKGMTKPLKVLTEGVKAIGKGNLDHRIEIKTRDELEELGKAFNQMTEDLKESRIALEESGKVLEVKVGARTKELQEFAEGLEEKVQERTKELQRRINELEKFHRLTVGRELKIIELKKALEQAEKRTAVGKQKERGRQKT